MSEPGRRALRLAALVVGAIAIAGAAYTLLPRGAPGHVASPPNPTSNLPDPTSRTARAWAGTPAGVDDVAALPGDPATATAASSPAVTIPLPQKLGGGKDVPPATRAIAQRLGLVPEELQDLALARGGTLPSPIVRRLDEAYARGLTLAQRLAVDPQKDDLVANRFANQLVRIDREMRRSPPGAKLDDVIAAVTNDTLDDLKRNVGPQVADAAKRELAATPPLPME